MSKGYVSEITQFINEFKKEHPGAEERQEEGFLRLWHKDIDTDLQQQYKAAKVSQEPYVYYSWDNK